MATPDENIALLKKLKALVTAADLEDKRWVPLYVEGIDYVFGNQLAGQNRPEGWTRTTMNRLYPALRQQKAMVAQRRPKVLVHAEDTEGEDNDRETAKMWGRILQWQFAKGFEGPTLLRRALDDAKPHGYWVAKVSWDPEPDGGWDDEQERWVGKVDVRLLRREEFGMDPNCESPKDAEYMFHRYTMPVERAKLKWPHLAKELDKASEGQGEAREGEDISAGFIVTASHEQVTPDGSAVGGGSDKGLGAGAEGLLAALVRGPGPEVAAQTGEGDAPKQVTFVEMYYRDRERVKERTETKIPMEQLEADGLVRRAEELEGGPWVFVETGELVREGNSPMDVNEFERPKYPTWRYVWVAGNGVILNPDEDDQAWPYKATPFHVGLNESLPHTWRGMTGVELAKSMQDAVNRILAHMENYIEHHSDPKWVVEENTVTADPNNRKVASKIGKGPGAIISVARGRAGGLKTIDPPQMSAGLMQAMSLYFSSLDDLVGMQDPGMGRKSAGQITASEAATLDANTKLPVGLQAIEMDEFTVRLMLGVAEILRANVQPGDMVRVLGKDDAASWVQATQQMLDLRFDITLEIGSVQPYDVERRKAEAVQLFEMVGPGFLEELLRRYEVTNVDELLEKNEAWTMISALMELAESVQMPPQQMMAMFEQFIKQEAAAVDPEPQQDTEQEQ